MGGHKETKKSLEQVKTDLLNQMTNNARTLLEQKFNITDNTTNLDTLLYKLATSFFKDKYKYDYSDDPTSCHPPDKHGDTSPKTSAKMCSIVPPIGNQVTGYLKAGVFSLLDLPQWMAQTAMNDLTNIANIIASRDTGTQWEPHYYKKTYDAMAEDQDSYRCDSVLVFCSGSLVEDGCRAQLAVIYYCGVYYNVVSETKDTRDNLLADAYREAAALVPHTTVPGGFIELQNILDKFAEQQFESHFSFKCGDALPDSLKPPHIDGGLITHNSGLHYVPDTKVDDLRNFADQEIFGGLNIGLDSVRKLAADNTFDHFQSILKDSTNSWKFIPVDKSYYTSYDLETNPVRQVGIIMSWYGHATAENGVPISVTYLYIMTLLYEFPNPKKELIRDMFKTLGNNLRRHIQGDSGTGDITNLIDLEKFMHSYAAQEFKQAFGFEYKGDESEPPNKKPTWQVRGYDGLLHLELPVNRDDVKKWMDSDLFSINNNGFPSWASANLYNDIVDRMTYFASDGVIKEDNSWYPDPIRKEYQSPSEKEHGIQHYAFYLYALGDMTLDVPGGKDGKALHLQDLFIYYLGVFSSYEVSPW